MQDEDSLRERVEFVHRSVGTDAIAEQYIEGRELTVSLLGNQRLTTFPIWELTFQNLPQRTRPIATSRVKWDLKYQDKIGVASGPAVDLPPGTAEEIVRLGKRIFRALNLSGYARVDLRMTKEGRVYVLEATPNPDLSRTEDFAEGAALSGIEYPALIQRLVSLGLAYRPDWKAE